MAEYLIQSETLDAIADAINAKTGGSSAMTPAEMVEAIAAIPTGGGGGMSWELIADYTSDEAAEIVKVLIPSGKQNSNVYKVQVNSSGASLYYPYTYINDTRGNYFTDGNRAANCVFYVVKKPADNNPEVGGSSDPSAFTAVSPKGVFSFSSPFVNVGLKAYSNRTIPAGFNIKVWRLVES